MSHPTQSTSVSTASSDSGPTSTRATSAGQPSRTPSVQTPTIDRLNLEAALRDFETANARVVDLTSRLTTMNEQLLHVRHELTLSRIAKLDLELQPMRVEQLEADLKAAFAERDKALAERDKALAERDSALAQRDTAIAKRSAAIAERDAARKEADVYRLSRSYRIGHKITRLARIFIP